jgi:hypothetical protein
MSQIWNDSRKLILVNIKSSLQMIVEALSSSQQASLRTPDQLEAVLASASHIQQAIKAIEASDICVAEDKDLRVVYKEMKHAMSQILADCQTSATVTEADTMEESSQLDEQSSLGSWMLSTLAKINGWLEEHQQNRRVHANAANNLLLQFIQVCQDAAYIAEEFVGETGSSSKEWYARIVKVSDLVADDNPALMLHQILSKEQQRLLVDKLTQALKLSTA